jgi:hypothetical protein
MVGEAVIYSLALLCLVLRSGACGREAAALALTRASGISAAIEFGPPSIPSTVDRDIPKRRVTVDERIAA